MSSLLIGSRRVLAAWALALHCVAGAGAASPVTVVRSAAAEAELVAALGALVAGTSVELGLRIKLDPGWHVYWKNPGDSGNAPTLSLSLPQGFKAGPLEFAMPRRIPVAHLVNYGYDGEVLFPVRVQLPTGLREGDVPTLTARAEWLECRESCLPAAADLSLQLPVAARAGRSAWTDRFEQTRARIPTTLADSNASARVQGRSVGLVLPALAHCHSSEFFPDQEGVFQHARITRVVDADGGARVVLPLDGQAPAILTGAASCVETDGTTRAYAVSVPIQHQAGADTAGAAHSPDFALAVAFAFLGGLVLNLMPCVFPVLGLKVLGLAHAAQGARGERLRGASAFAIGVVASFIALAGTMLALRALGQQIGWGFQLQSPWFVSLLALLFFVLALNLCGQFEWGATLQSAAGSAGARLRGPFFDGVLAVMVASPCTAPFMGAALGYTLVAQAPEVFAVFVALGLGMAAPFVLLASNPRWLARLPRPGPWLETTRQLFAFPMFATALWLAWVLGELAGLAAAVRLGAVLLAIAFALWLWRRLARRAFAMVIAIATVAAAALWLHAAIDTPVQESLAEDKVWQPYSRARVDALRSQSTPVFVDFTAAWCITCQVNKQVVLGTSAVTRALRESGTVAMRADWTRRDPEIARALAELGRNGVPVYAVYSRSGDVTMLPEILTTRLVVDALQGASR